MDRTTLIIRIQIEIEKVENGGWTCPFAMITIIALVVNLKMNHPHYLSMSQVYLLSESTRLNDM